MLEDVWHGAYRLRMPTPEGRQEQVCSRSEDDMRRSLNEGLAGCLGL